MTRSVFVGKRCAATALSSDSTVVSSDGLCVMRRHRPATAQKCPATVYVCAAMVLGNPGRQPPTRHQVMMANVRPKRGGGGGGGGDGAEAEGSASVPLGGQVLCQLHGDRSPFSRFNILLLRRLRAPHGGRPVQVHMLRGQSSASAGGRRPGLRDVSVPPAAGSL